MSEVESLSWADEERYDDTAPDHYIAPHTPQDQERRHQLAQQLEQRLTQRSTTPLRRLKTPSSRSNDTPDMEDVRLQFMDLRGGLKPGGTSSIIPEPTYYRARSASSAASRKSSRKWRYFDAEASQYIDHQNDEKPQASNVRKTGVFTAPRKPHTKSEDLKNQCSLSNKLLNVMTIDDYQERYYGRRVKSATKFGHRISRASSASTRTCTPDRRPLSGKTDSRPGSTKRPTSSVRAESGIYDVESEYIQDDPTSVRDMPLEYFAMLETQVDSDNAVVDKGFEVLMKSNECVRNTSSKLYREETSPSLSTSDGSEFFKRLKATLRYQLLVGDGLPSKSRYKKALRMHQREEQEVT